MTLSIFRRTRISRDLDFDQIDNPAKQFRLRMALPVLRPLRHHALHVSIQCIQRVAERRVTKQPPAIALRTWSAAHNVTSSGIVSSSLAVTPETNRRSASISWSGIGPIRSGWTTMSFSRNARADRTLRAAPFGAARGYICCCRRRPGRPAADYRPFQVVYALGSRCSQDGQSYSAA